MVLSEVGEFAVPKLTQINETLIPLLILLGEEVGDLIEDQLGFRVHGSKATLEIGVVLVRVVCSRSPIMCRVDWNYGVPNSIGSS